MNQENYWIKSLSLSKNALENSSLKPINTNLEYLSTATNLIFEYRRVSSINFKFSTTFGPKENPFRPWDKRLQIDTIGNNHILILNKYPVQIGHMLLITRKWYPQDGWLNQTDWEALKAVEKDTSGLWFFNSGPKAGASQNHRHLQLLRRKILDISCPLESWYEGNQNINLCESSLLRRNICSAKRSIKNETAYDLHNTYIRLCDRIGLGAPDDSTKPNYPYNLLISPNWIGIIRRSKEYAYGFSLNALAFAGYLLGTNKSNNDWLNKNGPIKLLEEVVAD
ncbi:MULTISPECIES: ATP adenylyltransferase family protein [Prochlorococcus]|uniref:ATP adenylyltransferase n=1 Tax=Prochlorococcus marinus (strain SARG / CCMP1375 / SS120) TaxID=167539 RepID=Q7VBY1_PROMA|nr:MULTISPECIES: DUF4922 domain-containing protein [Prochlorococcus]AAQ00006.1 ATP adenylyltransferase [Prochlorococcus marinus subsp. marinus str. CCMP1375]KGG13803.1 putative ATP adenylyltransferase [Prochlorococcus marinus str. LG]KGG18938.1 putative ATP adenylyltransferase [Prochlorococcus marinus str. SS2]KGG23524.1 putative ATP adenylyltransferase [Prochlorococcus marinus str. SS35]KGG32240.1 putative ATP adenylyltransferase [Prochlorococcus marinus str. SS51]